MTRSRRARNVVVLGADCEPMLQMFSAVRTIRIPINFDLRIFVTLTTRCVTNRREFALRSDGLTCDLPKQRAVCGLAVRARAFCCFTGSRESRA